MRCTLPFSVVLLSSVAFTTLSHAPQNLPTNGTIDSRFGKLEIENGCPSLATVDKLYNELDFQRAVQAYLWALPLMAMT